MAQTFNDDGWVPVAPPATRRVGPATRAKQLLVRNLTPAQLREWGEDQSVTVRGNATGKRYRIDATGAVWELDMMGKETRHLCFYPTGPRGGKLARGDVVLAQKVALERDELATRKIANIMPGWAAPGRRGHANADDVLVFVLGLIAIAIIWGGVLGVLMLLHALVG